MGVEQRSGPAKDPLVGVPSEVKETKFPPRMAINLTTREVTLESGGFSQTISGPVQWGTLLYLAQHAQEDISGERIAEIATDVGSRARNPVRSTISWLRKKLEINPRRHQLISRHGTGENLQYRLNAEVEFVREERKGGDLFEPQRFTFPDGQAVEIGGVKQTACLRILLGLPEDRLVSRKTLAQNLYGHTDEVAEGKIYHLVVHLNKRLGPSGWQIFWQGKAYCLTKTTRGDFTGSSGRVRRAGSLRSERSLPEGFSWERTEEVLRVKLPDYNERFASHTAVLEEFWRLRREIIKGGDQRQIGDFEAKYPPDLLDSLAPAFKEILSLVSNRI